jgi:hypothetical protein
MDVQAVMHTHLSQPTGAGAFGGQHGISSAISSVVADDDDAAADDISSAIACIEESEAIAMTGRATGAIARLAVTRIANSRRMVNRSLTWLVSHKLIAMQN